MRRLEAKMRVSRLLIHIISHFNQAYLRNVPADYARKQNITTLIERAERRDISHIV